MVVKWWRSDLVTNDRWRQVTLSLSLCEYAYTCIYMHIYIDRQRECDRPTLLSLSFSFSFILSTSTYVLDVGLRVEGQQNKVWTTCFFLKNHQIGWMAEWSKALVSGTSLRARVRIPLQSCVLPAKKFECYRTIPPVFCFLPFWRYPKKNSWSPIPDPWFSWGTKWFSSLK